MSNPINHLALSAIEKNKLRENKIRVGEIHGHSVKELQSLLSVSRIRAMELYALSEFQSLPSIGIRFAYDLIGMGFYSLKDLKTKDGAKLTDAYEKSLNVWVDPCVEDQFRLVVHYATHPNQHKNWWDFTAERKAFREKHGYPSTRPKNPWFELPHYQTAARFDAVSTETKEDLHRKLRLAIAYMKKHLDDPMTVKSLADKAHLSVYHFIRCFKNAYEVTPLQFLTHQRLKKACQFLKKTQKSIHEIGPSCGFENESSFIRLFKREFKVTPKEYRRLNT